MLDETQQKMPLKKKVCAISSIVVGLNITISVWRKGGRNHIDSVMHWFTVNWFAFHRTDDHSSGIKYCGKWCNYRNGMWLPVHFKTQWKTEENALQNQDCHRKGFNDEREERRQHQNQHQQKYVCVCVCMHLNEIISCKIYAIRWIDIAN